MASRDFVNTLRALVALAPGAAITTATNGAIIDTAGADATTFTVNLADVEAAESIEIKLQHGDDSGLSDAADVGSADVLIAGVTDNESGGTATVTVTDTEGDGVYKIGYVGSKRYVRVVVTPTGGDGVLAAAQALQSRLHQEP